MKRLPSYLLLLTCALLPSVPAWTQPNAAEARRLQAIQDANREAQRRQDALDQQRRDEQRRRQEVIDEQRRQAMINWQRQEAARLANNIASARSAYREPDHPT